MRAKSRQSGLTLMEMTVVITTVALFTVLGLPAIRTFFNSLGSSGGAQAMISAALSSARAIAAKEQHYAGIRFQKAYHPEGPLKADQYMIFIIYDTEIPHLIAGNLGCRAVKGLQPIKLPNTVGVMDLNLGSTVQVIDGDGWINDPWEITDTTAFSVIFSPSGKLVIHDLWVRNRNGVADNSSNDDIFNTETNIRDHRIGMFLQDDNSSPDLRRELSRNSFIIYEKEEFRQAYEKVQAYSGYLERLVPETIYINPYTGTIISAD